MDIWNNKYDVITVDPPWPIKKSDRTSRPNQGKHLDYSTMDLESIKTLPVGNLANDNSMCFLWTIQRFLREAFVVLESWGFKYCVTITWDKQNGMCMFGFHKKTEFILVGYRGALHPFPERKAMPTLITESSWGKHSVKPDVFYMWAETFGNNRVDLFARKPRDGWDSWGNEV